MEIDELIRSLKDYYGSYHNHKEQMAYGATVLYLTGATFVTLNGDTIKDSIKDSSVPWFAVIGLFFLALSFTSLFVWWQLSKRRLAADIVEACITLLTQLAANPTAKLETQAASYEGLDFPKALVDTLGSNRAKRKFFQSPIVSEGLTYFAIALWSICAWLSIWLSTLHHSPAKYF